MGLVHPENRIVTPYQKSQLVHFTTFGKDTEGDFHEIEEDIGIPVPEIYNKSSIDDLLTSVSEMDWQVPGIVIQWIEDGETKRTRLRNPNYENVGKLRGERRSMVERYLELKSDPSKAAKFQEFCKYYPEYQSVEQRVVMASRFVHQTYLAYFVQHSIQYIPDTRIWDVLNELHTRFLRTREKTTFNLVKSHVNSLPYPRLA